jgi:hypothetical protein
MDTKELFMELNKVNFKDPKTLTKFISTYGLPTGEEIKGGNEEYKSFFKMDTFEFIKKLMPLKTIIELWNAIQENDLDSLAKFKKRFEIQAVSAQIDLLSENPDYKMQIDYETKKFLKENTPYTHDDFKMFFDMKDKDLVEIGYAHINALLNKQSIGQRRHLLTDVPCPENRKTVLKKKIVEAYSFKDLFEVAYFQLSQMIINGMKTKNCEHCGFPFEVTHERQRFCSPLFGRKRSTCENTYNQRIKRQRQKEKQ